jgi:hypothetical protein
MYGRCPRCKRNLTISEAFAISTQPFGRPPAELHHEVDGFLARHSTLLSGGAPNRIVPGRARSAQLAAVVGDAEVCAGVVGALIDAAKSTQGSLPPRLLPRHPRFG